MYNILAILFFIIVGWLYTLNAVITKNKRLTRQINELKCLLPTETPLCLDGVFEIHITIDPENNYLSLLDYANQYEGMKVVYAISAVKNNQYMLSYFTRKNDDKLAVEKALHMASELEAQRMNVVRVKVEGHGVNGTPMSNEDYTRIRNYLRKKYNKKCGNPYFEFHVKVSNKKLSYIDLEKHVNILTKDKDQFTAVSHNLCSVIKQPLLTIRAYNCGYLDASAYKDFVIDNLKLKGYTFGDKIQQEFSIYDSNSMVDMGWLGCQ
jgi:hypothetical protein